MKVNCCASLGVMRKRIYVLYYNSPLFYSKGWQLKWTFQVTMLSLTFFKKYTGALLKQNLTKAKIHNLTLFFIKIVRDFPFVLLNRLSVFSLGVKSHQINTTWVFILGGWAARTCTSTTSISLNFKAQTERKITLGGIFTEKHNKLNLLQRYGVGFVLHSIIW